MNVLILAPEGDDRLAAAALLESLAHEVVAQLPASAPADAVISDRFDVVLLDLAGGQDALRFLRKRSSDGEAAPVVCVADRRRLDASAEALRLGAIDVVGRPITAENLQAALGNARELSVMTHAARGPEPPTVEATPEGLFGASPVMREVLTLARRVGSARCAVLITGERGTGREMVARTIHAASMGRALPFVKITCPGVSDSELTAALEPLSPGATVYLEDLAELPIDLQVRIEEQLRVAVADMEPGFANPSAADEKHLRFLAGAQPHIWDWIERNLVRRELVDALSVVRIDLPPLRQRKEDLPLLAMHFLKAACRENGVPPKTFSRPALTLLSALPWRGNATELRALCERLAVLVTRGVVLLEDLLENVRFDGAEALGRRKETLKLARERFERDYIASTLQHHHGRMGAAAQELGIERTNLYRKIRHLSVRWTGEGG